MKRLPLIALFLLTVFSAAASAQEDFTSRRLETAAGELKRNTVDLVDRTAESLRRSGSATRAEIEEAFVAHQLDASAGLFQQMVRDSRRAAELREAATLMGDLARRAPSAGANGDLWRGVQTALGDINREIGNTGGSPNPGGGNPNPDNRPVSGRVFWRGMVDDKVQLVIRERTVTVQTIAGRPYPEGNFSFTAALPSRRVAVEVNKTRGRGNVRVIQQPTRDNDFTAIVEISDTDGGAREYQLDVFWR